MLSLSSRLNGIPYITKKYLIHKWPVTIISMVREPAPESESEIRENLSVYRMKKKPEPIQHDCHVLIIDKQGLAYTDLFIPDKKIVIQEISIREHDRRATIFGVKWRPLYSSSLKSPLLLSGIIHQLTTSISLFQYHIAKFKPLDVVAGTHL